MDKRLKETIAAFRVPPKMVHNDRGETVEVILSYDEYRPSYVSWPIMWTGSHCPATCKMRLTIC
jgi:hypothetical protein